MIVGCMMWTAPFKSFHSNSVGVWALTVPLQKVDFLLFCKNHSVVNLLWCLGSLSCCIAQILLSFSCHTAILWDILINLGIHFSLHYLCLQLTLVEVITLRFHILFPAYTMYIWMTWSSVQEEYNSLFVMFVVEVQHRFKTDLYINIFFLP